jgi:hypothetical protein
MSAHALLEPMVNRAELEIDRLKAAEGVLDLGQALVGPHRLIGGQCGGRHAGAHDVDAVERRLTRNTLFIASKAEAGLLNG